MSAFDTAVKFFQDSGLFIYPSILIMALGLAIAIERFVFLNRARAENRKLWEQMLPHAAERQVQGGAARVGASPTPRSARSSPTACSACRARRRREDIDAAMEEGMMEIVPRLEKRTHYIATFANVITLVGLLGTIIGLIKGFTAVAQVNPAEKAELLSASISIAMNNTAFALMVAIPFLLIHAFLQARTTRDRRRPRGREDQLPEPGAAHRRPKPRRRRADAHVASKRKRDCHACQTPAQAKCAALEVTAFINLIVVLVPFLLSTAVFTRLAVMDLTLPAQSITSSSSSRPTSCKLEVVIRADALEVGDRIGGLIQRIAKTATVTTTSKALGTLMQRDQAEVSRDDGLPPCCREPDTSYDVLVQVMDARARRPQVQRRQGRAQSSCSPTSRSATRRSAQKRHAS